MCRKRAVTNNYRNSLVQVHLWSRLTTIDPTPDLLRKQTSSQVHDIARRYVRVKIKELGASSTNAIAGVKKDKSKYYYKRTPVSTLSAMKNSSQPFFKFSNRTINKRDSYFTIKLFNRRRCHCVSVNRKKRKKH